LPVTVERSDGSTRHEYAVNLSASGLCLHAQAPLSIGEEVRISFCLPSDPREIRAVCKVVWTRHEGELHPIPRCYETGLFLVEIAACDAERLGWFVSAQVDRR
jgi:Tfp pilus assembly protein PilZ